MLPFLAPGGLIIITTKSKTFGKGRKIKFNIKAWFPQGYRAVAEFYAPKYETEEELKKGPDRRTTIFWKPDVVFEDGNAQFDFYTADAKTNYSVVIEGVAENGQIVRKTEKDFLEKGK
jgi:siroheme synthase (precorrin-2 oxidase/ferrochelatase)